MYSIAFSNCSLGIWPLSIHDGLIFRPHGRNSFPEFPRFRDMMLVKSFLGPSEMDNLASCHNSRVNLDIARTDTYSFCDDLLSFEDLLLEVVWFIQLSKNSIPEVQSYVNKAREKRQWLVKINEKPPEAPRVASILSFPRFRHMCGVIHTLLGIFKTVCAQFESQL